MLEIPQLLAILGVFALLGFTLWWLKRRGAVQIAPLPFRMSARNKGTHPKMLQRVDALQLSPTHSLNLVRMADRAILIGISTGGFFLVESSSWKTLDAQVEATQ
ncbi:MAG: flagellar biosynthetic protein FliO [Acidobacteriota bacterium]|nr:flagellar biosynthetic protein FliO [Acidobacteriota bacterium]